MSHWLKDCFGVARPLVGMLHAPPLAGSPRYSGSWRKVQDHVLRDAEVLAAGGVHGLLLENYGDAPFFPGRVPSHVASCLTALAVKVRSAFDLPLGINVLRNDGCTALEVALAAQAQFIRVNILCGARVTDQGLIQGIAHELLRLRRDLNADDVRILADVDVKHSAPLAARPIEEEVDDVLSRGLANALIVSGVATGKPTDAGVLKQVRTAAAGRAPVFVGSGVSAENIDQLGPDADGFIVGMSLKREGRSEEPVDLERVRALMKRAGH